MSSTPDMSAETGAGAWLWASGSQLCIGASPAFVPYPRTIRPIASRTTPGFRCREAAISEVQSSDPAGWPLACRAAK